MDFTPLTTQQREQFETQGFLVIPNVLDQATITHMIEICDQLMASDQQENRQAGSNGQYDSFRNCITMHDAFIPFLTHPKTFPLIVQLLGPRIHLVTSHLIYKYPDPANTPITQRVPGWHRDGGTMDQDLNHTNLPRTVIKCGYYLTDLSKPNSGATIFSPGSHLKDGRLQLPEGQPDPENSVEPLLNPGDAVIFENRVYHSSSVNLSDHARKVFMFGYGYQWIKPFDYITQPERLIAGVDDIGKQLLNGLRDPQGHFIANNINYPLTNWYKTHCA